MMTESTLEVRKCYRVSALDPYSEGPAFDGKSEGIDSYGLNEEGGDGDIAFYGVYERRPFQGFRVLHHLEDHETLEHAQNAAARIQMIRDLADIMEAHMTSTEVDVNAWVLKARKLIDDAPETT